jgi:translation initiation factor 1 (eIF-1/SUI1)
MKDMLEYLKKEAKDSEKEEPKDKEEGESEKMDLGLELGLRLFEKAMSPVCGGDTTQVDRYKAFKKLVQHCAGGGE